MAPMTAELRANQVEEVRRALTDPVRVARRLGLDKGAQRQAGGGITVRCPSHREKTPSCSLSKGPDSTLRVHCFGCGWSGDCISLVAIVRGLDVRREFRDVLRAAAEVGGLHQLAEELDTGRAPTVLRVVPPLPPPEPERQYPPLHEVEAVWNAALPVAEVEACAVALALRGLFPGPELARAITGALPAGLTHPGGNACQQSATNLPTWARFQGRSWVETGHLVLVPVFDHLGALRSLRAWRVTSGDTPKRLPPAGHRSAGLILANESALRCLREPGAPLRALIVEGEPDLLAADQGYPGTAVFGALSGGWSQAFADRIPLGSEIAIHTHHDPAGEKYAEHIKSTLSKRAIITRSKP